LPLGPFASADISFKLLACFKSNVSSLGKFAFVKPPKEVIFFELIFNSFNSGLEPKNSHHLSPLQFHLKLYLLTSVNL
ncbi:hypothetical protein RFZ44_27980, partial [Acinetobacter sp. 163]|nr:hypothetical protein [Acinetobacter sp. 163]